MHLLQSRMLLEWVEDPIVRYSMYLEVIRIILFFALWIKQSSAKSNSDSGYQRSSEFSICGGVLRWLNWELLTHEYPWVLWERPWWDWELSSEMLYWVGELRCTLLVLLCSVFCILLSSSGCEAYIHYLESLSGSLNFSVYLSVISRHLIPV